MTRKIIKDGRVFKSDEVSQIKDQQGAGLQITRKPGQGLEVIHACPKCDHKEAVEIYHNGFKGGSYVSFRIKGAHSFHVNRLNGLNGGNI